MRYTQAKGKVLDIRSLARGESGETLEGSGEQHAMSVLHDCSTDCRQDVAQPENANRCVSS